MGIFISGNTLMLFMELTHFGHFFLICPLGLQMPTPHFGSSVKLVGGGGLLLFDLKDFKQKRVGKKSHMALGSWVFFLFFFWC